MAKERKVSFKKRKSNRFDMSGQFGVGYTSKDEPFYFDLEDYDKIKDYYWYIDAGGYVVSKLFDKLIYMHRLVCNCCNNNYEVDHIRHNKNDNRKSELRICEHKNNGKNLLLRIDNKSGVTGVSIRKENCKKKYRASIRIDGKNVHLGSFENIEDAIKARKEAEAKYYGEYSYSNSKKIGGDSCGETN